MSLQPHELQPGQAPLSMRLSGKKTGNNRLPLYPPRDLSTQGLIRQLIIVLHLQSELQSISSMLSKADMAEIKGK